MAAFSALLHRLERTLHRNRRLHVEAIYRNSPMPGWIREPHDEARRNAGKRGAVLIVNVKGSLPGDAVCIMRLQDFEALACAVDADAS